MHIYLLVLSLAIFWAYIIHKSRFCTMGAISDYLAFGGINRLQLIALAMSTAVIGTQLLIFFNIINKEHLPYTTTNIPLISHLVGGIIFGIGMMLASGCPTQQCVNLGKGNLKSLFSIPLIAISAQITISGSLSQFRLYINTLLNISYADINSKYRLLGIIIGLILMIVTIIWIYKINSNLSSKSKHNNIIHSLKYGISVGLIVVMMWYISGNLAFIPEDEFTLEYAYIANSSRTIQGLSMILPHTYLFDWLMYSSDSMRILNANTMLIIGLIFGSFLISIVQIIKYRNSKLKNDKNNSSNQFNWQFFKTSQDFIQYFIGSICMGVGGVFALGCSIGQGLSGFSTLSLGSIFSIIGIYIGAKIIYRYS